MERRRADREKRVEEKSDVQARKEESREKRQVPRLPSRAPSVVQPPEDPSARWPRPRVGDRRRPRPRSLRRVPSGGRDGPREGIVPTVDPTGGERETSPEPPCLGSRAGSLGRRPRPSRALTRLRERKVPSSPGGRAVSQPRRGGRGKRRRPQSGGRSRTERTCDSEREESKSRAARLDCPRRWRVAETEKDLAPQGLRPERERAREIAVERGRARARE